MSEGANHADKIGFSVVTPTNRPYEIENIVANFDRQNFREKELIIILNSNQIIKKDIEEKYRHRKDIFIWQMSEMTSLGSCLNYGYSKANYKYIAKFDDDDYYGKYYLKEAYLTFQEYQCDLVCKASLFYYLQGLNELILLPSLITKPEVARRGAGATICMTKEVFQKLQYSNLRRGVDLDIFIRARKMGLKILSTSSYHFLCIRSNNTAGHTWGITNESLENKRDREFGIFKMSLNEACQYVNQMI